MEKKVDEIIDIDNLASLSDKMRTIEFSKYGPPNVLHLKEMEKPTPKKSQVLIKVYATTVTAGDCEIRGFRTAPMFGFFMRMLIGFFKPRIKILGQELAGEIEAVGKNVTLFKKGDQIFAATGIGFGAYAEYKCISEKEPITLKPTNMTYGEAAAVITGGITALYFLRKAKIQKGKKILIYGASGSIGTFAVQLANYFEAEVTGVCSTSNLELVKSLGANKVIDYTKEDFTKNGEKYDIIFDTLSKSSYSSSIKSLKKKGIYYLGNAGIPQMFRGLWTSIIRRKKVIYGAPIYKKKDLIFLKKLNDEGKFKSVIDRTYNLEQMAEAHKYVDKGHKKGNVVITIKHK